MLTGTLRPHRTRKTEDHNDEPGTDCLTFDRAEKEKYNTDTSGKKSAVNSMSSSMLAVCQLRKQENRGQRFAPMGRFFSGSPVGADEKYGGQDRDQREGSSVQAFRRQPAATGDPENTAYFPSCTQSRTLPPVRGGTSYTLAPGPGTSTLLWRKDRNKAHVFGNLLGSRTTSVTPEFCFICYHRHRDLLS